MNSKILKHLISFKKTVALITAAFFIYSSVMVQGINAIVDTARDEEIIKQLFGTFDMPFTLARVSDSRYYEGKELVIAIQDLHCHPEMQMKISEVLSLLDKKFNLNRVYVEGAIGKVSTGRFSGIKNKNFKDFLINALLKQGLLTGSEYYSVISNKKDLLFGIEKEKPYFDNLVRLKDIEEKKKNAVAIILNMEQTLRNTESVYYNSRQKRLERLISENKLGMIATEKYYLLLNKYAKKLRIESGKYKNLNQLLKLSKLQRTLRYKKISEDIRDYVSFIKNKYSYSVYQGIVEKTNNFQNMDLAYFILLKIASIYNLNLEKDYPDLKEFFDYLSFSKSINPLNLVNEEKDLIKEIKSNLSKTQSEKEIVFLGYFLDKFKDYLEAKISVEDYDYIKKNFEDFKNLWSKYTYDGSMIQLSEYLSITEKFYQVNVDRNEYFLNNLLGMESKSLPPKENVTGKAVENAFSDPMTKDKNIRVVVTGGFHTSSLTDLLKRKCISYIVITPNISTDTKYSDQLYEALAKEQGRILSQAIALWNLCQQLESQNALIKSNAEREVLKTAVSKAEEELTKLVNIKKRITEKDVLEVFQKFAEEWNSNLLDTFPQVEFEYSKESKTFSFKFKGYKTETSKLVFSLEKNKIKFMAGEKAKVAEIKAGEKPSMEKKSQIPAFLAKDIPSIVAKGIFSTLGTGHFNEMVNRINSPEDKELGNRLIREQNVGGLIEFLTEYSYIAYTLLLDMFKGRKFEYLDISDSEFVERIKKGAAQKLLGKADPSKIKIMTSYDASLIQENAWAFSAIERNADGTFTIYIHQAFWETLKNKSPPQKKKATAKMRKMFRLIVEHETNEYLNLNENTASKQYNKFLKKYNLPRNIKTYNTFLYYSNPVQRELLEYISRIPVEKNLRNRNAEIQFAKKRKKYLNAKRVLEDKNSSKRDLIKAIKVLGTYPYSGSVNALAEAMEKYKYNTDITLQIVQAIKKAKQEGVLSEKLSNRDHFSIIGAIWKAVEEFKPPEMTKEEFFGRFRIIMDNPYDSLRLEFLYPEDAQKDIDQIARRIRGLYLSKNIRINSNVDVNLEKNEISIKFIVNEANLTDFWRVMEATQDFKLKNNRYRPYTADEIIDKLEERAQIILSGIADNNSPEYRRIINYVYGNNTPEFPGLINIIKYPEREIGGKKLKDLEVIPVESSKDFFVGEQRSENRCSYKDMLDLAHYNPYFAHFLPEKDIQRWVFLARAAGSVFTSAYIKELLRGYQEYDYMLFVSKDVLGITLSGEISHVIEHYCEQSADEHVQDFKALQLAVMDYFRDVYYKEEKIKILDFEGYLRFRKAKVWRNSEGDRFEIIPVYDKKGKGSRLIAEVYREKKYNKEPAITDVKVIKYDPVTRGEKKESIEKREVIKIKSFSDLNANIYAINGIYQRIKSTPILSNLRRSDLDGKSIVPSICLVDELADGSWDFITKYAIEENTRKDMSEFDEEELKAELGNRFLKERDLHVGEDELVSLREYLWKLRKIPPEYMTQQQLDDRVFVDNELNKIRETDSSINVQIFIGSPRNEFTKRLDGYPKLKVENIMRDFKMTYDEAVKLIEAVTKIADFVPHGFSIDATRFKTRPIIGESPIRFENRIVQLGAYLKSLLMYKGVIDYYESEYKRLSVQALKNLISDKMADIDAKKEAIKTLAEFPYPDTLTYLLNLLENYPDLKKEIKQTSRTIFKMIMNDAIEFDENDKPIFESMNYKNLISHQEELEQWSDNELIGDMAQDCLIALGDAHENFIAIGVPVEVYGNIPYPDINQLKARGVFIIPIVAKDPVEQLKELKKRSDELSLINYTLFYSRSKLDLTEVTKETREAFLREAEDIGAGFNNLKPQALGEISLKGAVGAAVQTGAEGRISPAAKTPTGPTKRIMTTELTVDEARKIFADPKRGPDARKMAVKYAEQRGITEPVVQEQLGDKADEFYIHIYAAIYLAPEWEASELAFNPEQFIMKHFPTYSSDNLTLEEFRSTLKTNEEKFRFDEIKKQTNFIRDIGLRAANQGAVSGAAAALTTLMAPEAIIQETEKLVAEGNKLVAKANTLVAITTVLHGNNNITILNPINLVTMIINIVEGRNAFEGLGVLAQNRGPAVPVQEKKPQALGKPAVALAVRPIDEKALSDDVAKALEYNDACRENQVEFLKGKDRKKNYVSAIENTIEMAKTVIEMLQLNHEIEIEKLKRTFVNKSDEEIEKEVERSQGIIVGTDSHQFDLVKNYNEYVMAIKESIVRLENLKNTDNEDQMIENLAQSGKAANQSPEALVYAPDKFEFTSIDSFLQALHGLWLLIPRTYVVRREGDKAVFVFNGLKRLGKPEGYGVISRFLVDLFPILTDHEITINVPLIEREISPGEYVIGFDINVKLGVHCFRVKGEMDVNIDMRGVSEELLNSDRIYDVVNNRLANPYYFSQGVDEKLNSQERQRINKDIKFSPIEITYSDIPFGPANKFLLGVCRLLDGYGFGYDEIDVSSFKKTIPKDADYDAHRTGPARGIDELLMYCRGSSGFETDPFHEFSKMSDEDIVDKINERLSDYLLIYEQINEIIKDKKINLPSDIKALLNQAISFRTLGDDAYIRLNKAMFQLLFPEATKNSPITELPRNEDNPLVFTYRPGPNETALVKTNDLLIAKKLLHSFYCITGYGRPGGRIVENTLPKSGRGADNAPVLVNENVVPQLQRKWCEYLNKEITLNGNPAGLSFYQIDRYYHSLDLIEEFPKTMKGAIDTIYLQLKWYPQFELSKKLDVIQKNIIPHILERIKNQIPYDEKLRDYFLQKSEDILIKIFEKIGNSEPQVEIESETMKSVNDLLAGVSPLLTGGKAAPAAAPAAQPLALGENVGNILVRDVAKVIPLTAIIGGISSFISAFVLGGVSSFAMFVPILVFAMFVPAIIMTILLIIIGLLKARPKSAKPKPGTNLEIFEKHFEKGSSGISFMRAAVNKVKIQVNPTVFDRLVGHRFLQWLVLYLFGILGHELIHLFSKRVGEAKPYSAAQIAPAFIGALLGLFIASSLGLGVIFIAIIAFIGSFLTVAAVGFSLKLYFIRPWQTEYYSSSFAQFIKAQLKQPVSLPIGESKHRPRQNSEYTPRSVGNIVKESADKYKTMLQRLLKRVPTVIYERFNSLDTEGNIGYTDKENTISLYAPLSDDPVALSKYMIEYMVKKHILNLSFKDNTIFIKNSSGLIIGKVEVSKKSRNSVIINAWADGWENDSSRLIDILLKEFFGDKETAFQHNLKERLRFIRTLKFNQQLITEPENSPFADMFDESKEVFDKLCNAAGVDGAVLYLMEDDTINCFCVPHIKTVVISTGLLRELIKRGFHKDALSFVMAHEIRHIVQYETKGKAETAARAFGREWDADRYALELMNKAGYNVIEATKIFEIAKEIESQQEILSKEYADIFRTFIELKDIHLNDKERIKYINSIVSGALWQNLSSFSPYSKNVQAELNTCSKIKYLLEQSQRVNSFKDLNDILAQMRVYPESEYINTVILIGLARLFGDISEKLKQNKIYEEFLEKAPKAISLLMLLGHQNMLGKLGDDGDSFINAVKISPDYISFQSDLTAFLNNTKNKYGLFTEEMIRFTLAWRANQALPIGAKPGKIEDLVGEQAQALGEAMADQTLAFPLFEFINVASKGWNFSQVPYEFVAESYIRKKMRAVSYLPQEDWQPYIDILSIIGKIHDEAFMDFSKSLNGDWRNLAKVVLYGKGLSREEKIKMFLDREYLVNCPHREEFGVRREINDDVLGFLVRYFEETGYSNERIKLLFKKLHDETQNDKFLEQISESFFNNIEQEHYDNYDFLNISVRDISKMLTYWEVRKSTSEAAKMLEKTFEYMRKKNLDIKEISLKLRDYINVLSSERRDEMYAGIVNEIFEKNVPDGAYDVSEDTKRMVCLASMGGEYYLIENDISSISEEDKKVLCLVLNSDYMYRKHAKEPYGSRDEMMKSLAVDITLGKLRSLKDVQDDWYAQVSDLAIKVFLGEMGVANSEDKYDQLQEFYKTFAEQRRGKYGPSAEEMRGLYIELFDTKKADPEVTDKYETLFNSIFKLPFYFDRTSPYAESREVLFRSDIFNFIFESPMPYEQIIEKAKTFLPPGPLRNFILLAAFLRETNIKYPNQPIYDLVKLKILIENDKSLVVLLEKILPLLNTDKRLGLENMFLLSYLIRRESGKKQTGLGAEDRLSFEKILPSEPGRQKKELKVVSAVKKMGEWFKLIYWVFVYMFLQKGIDLSPKLTLATSKGIFIKRGIDSRIWGTGRSKLILGDINKKRFIDKMRKGKQQGRKIDELLIGWLTAKYKISEDQLDALSEMQIINELMEHITSSWQEIYDTVPSIKKLKNVKQIVAQIDQVKRFKVPPQRAYAILLDYGRITNISSMLNIALLEAFYPNAIQRRYDKTVLRSIINNYNLENILRIVSKLNSKFLKKLEVGYFSMKRKNSGIDKINILFFDYNHPQKLAQLDSVLPQLLEKSIQSILSSDDTFEEKIAYICERFVNSQPARDKYLELIFTEEINLLKSRYNQALESGTIDNQIAELLNRIEKIRVSSKKFFNGYFSNHFLFLAMDLELKLKEGLTFDQKLELLIKYFPDKNYFRDDILKNFLINAETDGQYEKIDALLYTEKKGILEDEQLLGNSLTEQKVKIVLENLSVADRKDLMLWIIGIKEMPLQIREYEELMGISFESIRDLFAISRESKQYAYVGESSRNQLIEFMFWGDKGIISDEKLFADFMNELREFIVKKTNIGKTMSPKLLKKIFSAVIKHSSPRKKLELVQSLALNLSSLFEGEGEERDDYEIISKLMESLGIIGIKIAQMIAYSSDIQIPPKLREKFAELGSKAKPLNKQFAFETIKNLEMQKRFPSIGRLLGSASIKIVFEAILDTSEKVALKIKRPDVAQNLAEDLEMFKKVCNELRSRGVKIPEGFENRASGSIAEDANFEREIENTKKLESQLDEINEQKSYAINAETPSPRSVLFVVPKMYPGSNESVLISELVKGYDLGRGEELIKSGKLTAEEFRQLKGIIFDFLMTQLFEKGYYLGDPHGGNFRIVIEDDGSIKIYLIDVGAMNDLKPKEGETYIETYAKLLKGLACLKLGLKTSDDFIDEAIFFKRAGYLTEDLKTDEMLSEILKKIPEEFRPYASISQFKKAVARDILFGWIRRTEKRTLPGKIEARPSIPPQAIVKKPFMAIGWEYFRDKYKWDEKKVENYIKFKAPAIETAVFQIVGLAIIMLGLPLIGVLWAVLGFAVAHTILEWKVRAKDIGKNFLFRLGFGFLIFLPFAGIASLLALIPSTLLPIIANLINIVITILVASPLVYKFHSKFNIYLYDLKQKPDNELTPLQRRIKKLPFLAISNRIFFVDEFGESLPREPKQEYSWELTGQHFFEIEKFMQRLAGTGYDVAKVEELLRYGFSPGVTLKKDEKFGVVPEIEAPLSEKRKFADHFIMGQYREKVNKIRELVGNAIYKYTLEYHNHAGLGKLDENENFIIFDFLEYNENYSIGSAVDLYFRVVKVLKGLNLFDKLAGGPNITGIMQKCARSIGKKTEETERIVRLTIERLQKEGAWTEVPYMASYLVAPGTYQKYGELNNLPENWYRLDFVQNYNEKGEYIYSVQKRDCELNFAPKYELSFTILPTVAVSAAGIVINAIWGITIFANPLLAVIILVISHIVFLFMHQVTKERILGASLMGAASGVVFWYLSQIIGVSWLMPLIWAITALVNWSIHKIYQIIFPKATLSVGALKLKLNPEFQKDFDKMKKEIEDASRLPVNLKKTFLPMNVNMASPDIKLIKAEENKLFAEYFRVLQNDPTAVKNLKEALVQNGFNKNQILEIFKGKADISLSKQDRRKFYDVMFNKAKIWPLMQKGFDLGISKIEEYLTFKEFAKDFFERYVSEEKISLIKTVASIMFAEDNDEFAILYKQGAASITLEEENALKKGEIRGTTRSSFDMTSGRIQQVNVVVNLDSGGFGNILAITLHEMGHALLYGFLGTIGAQYSEEHDFVVEGIAEHFTVLSFKLLDAYEIFIAKKGLGGKTIFWEWSKWSEFDIARRASDAYKLGYILFDKLRYLYQMKSELFTEFIERMLKGELTLKEVTDVAVNSLQANSLLVKNLAKNFKTETFKKTLESIKAEKYNPDTEKALISMLLNYASDELVAPDSEVSLSRKKEIIKEVLESGKAEDILKAVYKKNKWFVSGPAQMFFAVDKGYMNLIRFICFAITENGAVKGNLDSSLLARFFYYLYMDKCERFNIIPNEQEFLGFVDRTFHIIKDTPGYSSISINITFEIANIQKYAQAQYRLNQQKTAMGKIAIDDAFRFRFTRIKTYQKYGKLNDLPENWYRRDLTQNYNEEGEYIYSKELRDCEINFAPKRERWATVFSPWFYASHFPSGLVPQGAERAEDLRWQGLQNIRHWALIPFKLGVGVAIISAVLGLGIGLIIAQIAFILAGLITATISISVGTVKALDVGQIFHRLSNAINSFLPMSEKQIITSRRANLRRDLAASKITRDDLKADVLIVCGNEDVDRYEDLLRLYAEEKVKYLILSGGIGRATPQLLFNAIKKGYKFDNLEVRDGKIFLKRDDGTVSEITKSGQGVSEAEIIYEIMNHMRTKLNIEISDERFESIRLEKSSRTTIENFKYSIENNKDLFEENAVVAYSAKPDQQLRTLITFNSVMDSIKRKGLVGVSYSDENAMKNFANDIQDEIMVREMQRLIVFLAINIIDSKGVVDKKYFKECLNSFVAFMEANPNKEKLNDIIINGISNAYVTEDKTKREKQWELFPTAEVFLSKIPKDLRTPQFDQYIEGLYIRAGRGEEVKAPVKKITTGFPAVRNILTLGIDRQNFDMRSIFTGSRIILWIKRQIAKRLPVYRYAPELLGKHYVVLSSNFNESVDKVRNIAEEGMNCISIAPLPESYTGSAVNLSKPIKEGGRNLGKVNVEGINIEISAEKIQTKKGSFWQLYYNLEKGAVIVEEMKRLFNARSLTSIAEWLKGNSAALEFMGKSIDTFNLDIIEMDDYLSVPELIKDRINKIVFKNSVLVHFGNRDESEISLPAREKIAKEFKGLGKDILFKKAFDVEIEESAKIADSLKTIEAVSKIKKEELLAKTEPSVYENLSTVGKSEEEIIEHIKNHNEMGIDTFIIIGADFKQAANLTKKFEAEIKNKQMHFIINYEINIASDITAQEKDILKLLKLGAYGVRLNMSEIKDSKKIGEIGNLMMKLKAKILKINPEAVLLVLPSELPEFEAIFKISDVKKVVRYLPGKMPARVPENCWLEMNIKGFNFEENMDVSIKDEIEKLIKAEVNVVGFDSEMTDNLELNGPVGFDIGGYLLRLINSRRDEFLRNPEERFKQAHFTALKQNEKDIPDIASIWEEMIALDKEYMASADNAVKDNSFVNKIYEKIKNLPNYEKYGVLSAYVERYHKLTVDELDPERKKLYLAALMGFVRGLMEANALRNYLGDITRITDEAERNRFAWGLVEFQIQTGIQLMINKDMKANERKAVFEGWIEKLINDPSLILDEDTAELLKSKENLSSNEFMNSLINLAAKADKNSLPIIIAETLMIIDLSIDTKAKDRVKALREGARPVLPEALKGLISAA